MLTPSIVVSLCRVEHNIQRSNTRSRINWGTISLKLVKDHLPWVATSAAIVLAATGYFDRSSSNEQVAQAPAARVSDVPAAPLTLAASSTSSFVPNDNDVVTRLSTVTDSSLQALQPQPAPTPAPEIVQLAPLVIEPQQPVVEMVEPEPVETRTASLSSTQSSADFFANAQANLAAQNSCVADLRALTEQARVYFPAGGLNADNGGIEQARLIGSLLQDCKGVQIIVEGHSDPSGNPAVNLRLSKQRAEQIIQRLGASGIDTSNFIAEGLGSKRPSLVRGTESDAYYDRRVEFVVIETQNANTFNRTFNTSSNWVASSCAKDLENAIQGKNVFYAPRSVAAGQNEMNTALELASMAMACPEVRLRVIGQHSDHQRAGENPATGRLRAKAMMAMLVGQGIDSGQIIIAAPSRSMDTDQMSGSRLDFDVIFE